MAKKASATTSVTKPTPKRASKRSREAEKEPEKQKAPTTTSVEESDFVRLQKLGAASFWNELWDGGYTGWKVWEADRDPTKQKDTSYQNFRHYLQSSAAVAATVFGGAESDSSAASKRRITVLVPLCGDSWVMNYFAEQWVSDVAAARRGSSTAKRNGPKGSQAVDETLDVAVDVIGIDLAPLSLKRVMDRFPEKSFGEMTITTPSSGVQGKAISHQLKFFFARIPNGSSLTLVEGDFYAALEDYFAPLIAKKQHAPFDLVYDRAAFVAIHPTERKRYCKAIVNVMSPPETVVNAALGLPRPAVIIELMLRDPTSRIAADGHPRGPPFHCDPEELTQKYFGSSDGFSTSTAKKPMNSKKVAESSSSSVPFPLELPMPPLLAELIAKDAGVASMPFRWRSFVIFR